MQRDIADYERAYEASEFEPVQARMRKRQLLEVLSRWRPARVLEVGCGSDSLLNHWRSFERFCIVEPGERFAAQARAHAGGDTRVRVVQGFMEDAAPQLAGEAFDTVLVSGLLHEVPDPQALLQAVARACTPATRLHVNVPNARSLHRLLAREMGLIADLHELSPRQRALQQPRTFDLDGLCALCARCGFEVTERGAYFVKPFTHAQMARLLRDGVIDERLLDGLYRLAPQLPGLGSEIYVHLRRAA